MIACGDCQVHGHVTARAGEVPSSCRPESELRLELTGERHRSVLTALAATHDQAPVVVVDVVGPQRGNLRHAQPGIGGKHHHEAHVWPCGVDDSQHVVDGDRARLSWPQSRRVDIVDRVAGDVPSSDEESVQLVHVGPDSLPGREDGVAAQEGLDILDGRIVQRHLAEMAGPSSARPTPPLDRAWREPSRRLRCKEHLDQRDRVEHG